MSSDWKSLKFKSGELSPKVIEGADPFYDQLETASYFQPSPPEEPPKKKVKDLRRGDKVKLRTGEVFEMSSIEVMRGTFFAFNVQNENDRRLLKSTDVEAV
jgi:hypothetical protein